VSGEVAFGAAISEDRQRASVVLARRGESGRVVVDLVFYDHPRLVVARMAELTVAHDPVATIVNPKSQSGTLIKPLSEAGVWVTESSAPDMAVAHGIFLDLVADGQLEHLDQKPLTDAVRAAQQRPLSGAKAWEPRLAVDQSPLVAATLAAWGFLEWERVSAPGIFAL
jgi:hypothetical protein